MLTAFSYRRFQCKQKRPATWVVCLTAGVLIPLLTSPTLADVLTTSHEQNLQGVSGFSFDLENTGSNTIRLSGVFRGNFDSEQLSVSVYTRSGSAYSDSESLLNSSAGWAQLGQTCSLTGNGYYMTSDPGIFQWTEFDVGSTIDILSGETLGVFIHMDSNGMAGLDQTQAVPITQGDLSYTPQQVTAGSPAFDTDLTVVGPTYGYSGEIEYDVIQAPEPATMGLLVLGGTALLRRRNRK